MERKYIATFKDNFCGIGEVTVEYFSLKRAGSNQNEYDARHALMRKYERGIWQNAELLYVERVYD